MRIALAIVLLMTSVTATPADDIVILSGRVIEPKTDLDATRNISVDRGGIAAISGFPLTGDVLVDASGVGVARGFGNLHAQGGAVGRNRPQPMWGVIAITLLQM